MKQVIGNPAKQLESLMLENWKEDNIVTNGNPERGATITTKVGTPNRNDC